MKVLLASAVVVLLALAFVGALVFWARWSRGRDANAVQVVAKNSGFLLLSQFTVKGLDFLVGLVLRLGTLALGWGPVGLASAALVANCVTLVPLILLIRWLGVRAEWSLPWGAARDLLRDGWPLLVNSLLASLFFRVDTFLL